MHRDYCKDEKLRCSESSGEWHEVKRVQESSTMEYFITKENLVFMGTNGQEIKVMNMSSLHRPI